MMILVLLLFHIVVSLSAASARAPETAQVQNGLLRWAPAAEEEEEDSRSVQVQSFEEERWSDLPQCVRTTEDSCDVSAVIRAAEHGCVRLRVRGQRSGAVEACSTSEDRCTPQLNLTAAPGSITVHLSRDHLLWTEYADHAQHCVRYWRQDQDKPEACSYVSVASQLLPHLQPGQTYCVEVQYRVHKNLSGLPRCPLCLRVPQAELAAVVLGVTLSMSGLGLGLAFVYVLLFHKKRIKRMMKWFEPQPQTEPGWLRVPLGGAAVCSSPTEEPFSVITGFREIEQD